MLSLISDDSREIEYAGVESDIRGRPVVESVCGPRRLSTLLVKSLGKKLCFAQHSKTETINDLKLFFHQLKLREFSPSPKTLRVNAVEKKKFSRK